MKVAYVNGLYYLGTREKYSCTMSFKQNVTRCPFILLINQPRSQGLSSLWGGEMKDPEAEVAH